MFAASTATDAMGNIGQLLETGGVAVAVILSLGVVVIVVGLKVALPLAKVVGQAMGDHRESAANAKETTMLASRATESAKESALLAQKTIEAGERVADRLIQQLERLP